MYFVVRSLPSFSPGSHRLQLYVSMISTCASSRINETARGAQTRSLVRNDSAVPQKDLSLQISSSLDWRSISLAGKPVEFVSKPYISDIDHTGALSEAIVVLPQEIPPHGVVEFDIGYEGVIPLDISRLTRLGVPENDARNTDWDQISESFSAVRGLGYVAWYPVATEAASLSQENSVPETIGEWKQRTAQADMTVNFCLWKKVDGPVKVLAGTKGIGSWTDEEKRTGLGGDDMICSQHIFSPLGQTVPMFALGGYETLTHDRSIEIAYLSQLQSWQRRIMPWQLTKLFCSSLDGSALPANRRSWRVRECGLRVLMKAAICCSLLCWI